MQKAKARDWENEESPIVEEVQVQYHLRNLKMHRSMRPNEVHPVLRELVDEVAKSLPIIFERSWQSGEVPSDWKGGNITPIFKKGTKRKTWGTTGQSVSPLCLARSWSRSS